MKFICILASRFTCMEIWQAYSVEQTVYFESQTDRVLIYVQSTAVIVLKYMGILSLDCKPVWTPGFVKGTTRHCYIINP